MAANLAVASGLSLHGQVVYTEASSSMSDLFLDDSPLPGIPDGFDYSSISELEGFSNLRIHWWYFEGGVKQLFSDDYVLEYALTYDDWDDKQPYIVDSTGSRLGMLLRFNWLF